jgi:biotin transporter BioY
VLGGAYTPIGFLIIVPLTLTGVSYDLTVSIADKVMPAKSASRWRYGLAASVSAVVLFLVSLPVMSPEHLTWSVLAATLGARLIGQLAASALAGLLARRVERAGILRSVATLRTESARKPESHG